MKKSSLIVGLLCLSGSLAASSSLAYSGVTGLFEAPNARIQQDFGATPFFSYDNPYMHYGVSTSVFPYMELNVHGTQLRHSQTGDKRDKVVSLKILLYPEGDFTPAIAYGMDDLWGDANYSSKYIVLSKRIKYLDFTLGYAVGRLGGSKSYRDNTKSSFHYIKDSSYSDGGVFGGVEFYATKALRFAVEGTSIQYEYDKRKPFDDEQDFHFNFGAKYDITDNLSSQISLQRGDTLSFSLNYNFSLFDKYEKVDNTVYTKDFEENLRASEFSNIELSKKDKALWLEANNQNSYYDLVDLSKATNSLLKSDAKDDYEYLYLDLNQPNKKVFKVSTKEIKNYQEEQVSNTYMKDALIVQNSKAKLYKEFKKDDKKIETKKINKQRFHYDIGATFKTFLLDEKDPIVNRTTLDLSASYDLASDIDINSTLSIPLFNNMDDVNKTSKYDRYEKPYLENLYASYFGNFGDNHYLNIDAGLLSQKYAGANIEYQKTFLRDKFGVSLQYQSVFSRDEDDFFKTYGKNKDAKFINLYYQLSKQKNTHIGLKAGEFIAGDRGYRVEIARSYGRYIFGAYVSRTKDEVYENNKGFYVKAYFDKKRLSNKLKPIVVDFNSMENDFTNYIDFDNSLFNRLSNENNLQLIDNNIHYLK